MPDGRPGPADESRAGVEYNLVRNVDARVSAAAFVGTELMVGRAFGRDNVDDGA